MTADMEPSQAFSSSDALFPAFMTEPEPATLAEPIIRSLRLILKQVTDLPDTHELRKAKAASLREVQQMIQAFHVRFGNSSIGQLVRRARGAAGLSVDQLSQLSGISTRVLSRVETGDGEVSQKTLHALCAVSELQLVPNDLLQVPRAGDGREERANYIVTHRFDAVQMMRDLERQLSGSGGAIEQTHVYMDHKSSADWIDLCKAPDYTAMFRMAFPHREAAKRIAELVGKAGLDLVALGPGDGKTEVQFTQHILNETSESLFRLYLLDASGPLLNSAYNHASEVLGTDRRIMLSPMQGTFLQLARYPVLNAAKTRSHRRRVYMMFGNTISNLDNEVSFLRSAFAGAAAGDLLIFDVCHAFTSSRKPEEIQKCDPAFSRPLGAHTEWLGGPIRRYCEDAEQVDWSLEVDAARPIEGSYGIRVVAKVHGSDERFRNFTMFNFRRYDPAKLSALVQDLGWQEVGRFPFNSTARPRSLLMFQRQK